MNATLPRQGTYKIPDEADCIQLRAILERRSPCEPLAAKTTAAQQWKKWQSFPVKGIRAGHQQPSGQGKRSFCQAHCTGSFSLYHASVFQQTPYRNQRNPDLNINSEEQKWSHSPPSRAQVYAMIPSRSSGSQLLPVSTL